MEKDQTAIKLTEHFVPENLTNFASQKKVIDGFFVSQADGASVHQNSTLRRRLSIARILTWRANREKANTLGGAFIFHNLWTGLEVEGPPTIAKKKEATENLPSQEAIQILLWY